MPVPRPSREPETSRLARSGPALTLAGPLAIGVATAGYAVAAGKLTVSGALAAGWALWQLTTIAVLLWGVAMAKR
jgi:hypothetical protein